MGAPDGGAVPQLAERIRQCYGWGLRLVLATWGGLRINYQTS